jgi:hypothetical protein
MPRLTWILIVVATTSFLTIACSPEPRPREAASAGPALSACEDPRPQLCTLQYEPVCGHLGGDDHKTYANACAACANAAVSGHWPGACE